MAHLRRKLSFWLTMKTSYKLKNRKAHSCQNLSNLTGASAMSRTTSKLSRSSLSSWSLPLHSMLRPSRSLVSLRRRSTQKESTSKMQSQNSGDLLSALSVQETTLLFHSETGLSILSSSLTQSGLKSVSAQLSKSSTTFSSCTMRLQMQFPSLTLKVY